MVFLCHTLRVCHDLTDKSVVVQLVRVHDLAAHDAALRKPLPDSHRVYVIHAVIFFGGVEFFCLDELGDPALYLGPRQRHMVKIAVRSGQCDL